MILLLLRTPSSVHTWLGGSRCRVTQDATESDRQPRRLTDSLQDTQPALSPTLSRFRGETMHWTNGDSSSTTSNSPPPLSTPSQPSDSPAFPSTSPTSPPPKKKITRTRTGCRTCRDRKVKCGEEKPQCLNCQRTNHICPGYAPATVFKARRTSRQLRDTSSDSPADTEGTNTSPLQLSV